MKNSAIGDKIDFAGKFPQLKIFVDKAYQLLINRKLEWIKIGDPYAGIADDIQYSTISEVHAYQMKWSVQNPLPNFSFNDFRHLLIDLVESWRNIVAQNPDKKVIIYIITNQKPSKHDKLEVDGKKVGSFSNFLIECYIPKKTNKKVDKKWIKFIQTELKHLGIRSEEFNIFLHNFEFNFDEKIPNYAENKHFGTIEQDQNKFLNFLCDAYYQKESKVQFNADLLRETLNLELRSRTLFFHDFFVDLEIYKPNTITSNALNEIVDNLHSGYVFLSGRPGTGKSTLLTEWIKTRNERIIRYYAYSNHGTNSPTRGEAKTLFFDLVIQIGESGYYDEKVFPYQNSIEQTQALFFKQLKLLNADYLQTGRKTIIIIDGLDHIPREYKVSENLIKYLPSPKDIPNGLLFILGSQTFDFSDLNFEIKHQLKIDNRHITVSPLTKEVVYNIISTFSIEDENIKEKIFSISEGHPLYLSYILKKIYDSSNQASLLDELKPIEGDIEEYYERIWNNYHQSSELINLLGLIVRLRFGFDERLVKEWDIQRDEQLLLKPFFNQFFNKLFNVWSVFHNSFKQFILKRTAEDIFSEKFDEITNVNFHKELARKAKISKIPLFTFERLYHLFHSNQYTEFTEEANYDYFTNQIESFRPFDFIRDDLRLELSIAAKKQDVGTLLRFAFLSAEFSRRAWNFNQQNLVKFFPDILNDEIIHQYNFVFGSEFETQRLKLKLARTYFKNSYHLEAKLLFRMSQPVEIKENSILLNSNKRGHSREEIKDLLREWALTAHYFIPVREVIHRIRFLKTEGDEKNLDIHGNDEDGRIRAELIFGLLDFFIENRENDKIKVFIDSIDFSKKVNKLANFNILERITLYFLKYDDALSASKILTIILKIFKKKDCNNNQKLRIAYLIFRVLKESKLVEEWFDGVSIPRINFKEIGFEKSVLDEEVLFKWLLLNQFLGFDTLINNLLPLQKENSENSSIEFERLFFYIAKIQYDADNKNIFDIRRVKPILHFFYQNYNHRHPYWYRITGKRQETIFLLINVIYNFGSSVISKFWEVLESEFISFPQYWKSYDLKIEIIIYLYEKGLNKIKVKNLF